MIHLIKIWGHLNYKSIIANQVSICQQVLGFLVDQDPIAKIDMSMVIDTTKRRGYYSGMSNKGRCPCVSKELKGLAGPLKVIAEENRLKIVCLLASGEQCVCRLVETLGLPSNLVSHHLKVLVGTGLVRQRRVGRFSYYRLEQNRISEFRRELYSLLGG